MSSTNVARSSLLRPLRFLHDHLWIEEKVVWAVALATALLLTTRDLPFSIRLVAIPYALFLSRIAAIVALIVTSHRLWMRFVRQTTYDPFTLTDVWFFLRTLAFYLVALTTYTNIKTRVLLLHPRVFDGLLETLDRWMFLGYSPTEVALQLTGRPAVTGAMDTAYTYAWVPLAIIFGVVFSQAGGEGFRRLARVISLNYLLGAALYVVLPAVGPAFAERQLYEPLRASRSFLIQNSLINVHNQVVAAPTEFLVPAFMGIAAFPSLHVSHIYLPLLVAWRRAKPLLILFVPAFLAVAASTVYFGWHWAIDIPAGMATIHLCFWLAARLERFEERARQRREARGTWRAPSAESLARGLGQWPAVAALAVLHLTGLIISFAILAPGAPLTWGSGAALVFFIFFWVLFELCLLAVLVALVERWAEEPHRRWVDAAKAVGLAGLWSLVLASLVKLLLTGSHLGSPDLWFLWNNLRQLAGEASGLEIVMVVGLLAIFTGVAGLLYRGFEYLRRHPVHLPFRSFLLLGLLALLGAVYPIYRYPEARFMAPRVVPELGWLLAAPAPTPLATASAQPLELTGAPIVPYSPTVPERTPNVLILMLESVSAKVLDAPEVATALPNLLALSKQAITFSRAYAPSVHSDYAQMAILSSLHPASTSATTTTTRLDYPRTLVWDALGRPDGARPVLLPERALGQHAGLSRARPGWSCCDTRSTGPPRRQGRGSETKVFEAHRRRRLAELAAAIERPPGSPISTSRRPTSPTRSRRRRRGRSAPTRSTSRPAFCSYPRDKVRSSSTAITTPCTTRTAGLGEIVRSSRSAASGTRRSWSWSRTTARRSTSTVSRPTARSCYEEQVRSLLLVRLPELAPRVSTSRSTCWTSARRCSRTSACRRTATSRAATTSSSPATRAAGRPFFFTIQGMTSEDGGAARRLEVHRQLAYRCRDALRPGGRSGRARRHRRVTTRQGARPGRAPQRIPRPTARLLLPGRLGFGPLSAADRLRWLRARVPPSPRSDRVAGLPAPRWLAPAGRGGSALEPVSRPPGAAFRCRRPASGWPPT